VKTILTAYRVSDLGRSLQFYEKFGFREIGRVAFEDGSILAMLNLVGDGDAVDAGAGLRSEDRFRRGRQRLQPYCGAGRQPRVKLADLAEKGSRSVSCAPGGRQRPKNQLRA